MISREATAVFISLLFVAMLVPVQATLAQGTSGSGLPRDIERGWTITSMLGRPVVARTDTSLGRLKNILVGPGGQIEALVVAGQGRTVSRDFQFRIPWSRVETEEFPQRIVISAAASERLGGVYSGTTGARRQTQELPVTELLGDDVRLRSGGVYGYVSDVLFSSEAELIALEVRRNGETYRLPVDNWMIGWSPRSSYYRLPYDSVSDANRAAIRLSR
jgi:sporulation protein YlmC with PRC-barrel domain